jgi:hypothetical protein
MSRCGWRSLPQVVHSQRERRKETGYSNHRHVTDRIQVQVDPWIDNFDPTNLSSFQLSDDTQPIVAPGKRDYLKSWVRWQFEKIFEVSAPPSLAFPRKSSS